MDVFIGMVGMVGFFVFLVLLLVSVVKKAPKKKKLLGLLVCFVLFVVGVSMPSSDNEEGKEPPPTTTPPIQSDYAGDDDIEASGNGRPSEDDIMTENYLSVYSDQEEYIGKYVRTVGVISSVGKNIAGVRYATFRDGLSGLTGSIYINFDETFEEGSVKEGDTIAIVGTVGTMMAGTLNIDDAYIDETVEDPKSLLNELKASAFDVEISATALLSAYDENEVNADNNYNGKSLKISGTIKGIGKDIRDNVYITLGSDNDKYSIVSVQCYFSSPEDVEKVSAIAKGDKITLIGKCKGSSMNILVKDCFIP